MPLDRNHPKYAALARAAHTFPVIDHHAHPLLKASERHSESLLGVVSESRDTALRDAPYTLAGRRALRQLEALLGLIAADSTTADLNNRWGTVDAARNALEYEELCKKCFRPARIACLLLDDGLGGAETRHTAADLVWHDRLTTAPTRRILRVEVVAEDILRELISAHRHERHPDSSTILEEFSVRLTDTLTDAARSPLVVGFKSVVCYRTGLAVSLGDEWGVVERAVRALVDTVLDGGKDAKVRLEEKALNDLVVRIAMEVGGKFGKPVQFHTGLGDNDLQLSLATPALLQPLVAAYASTPVVLLHGAYPFTREAGYLASTYANVYLDFGEVFPFVSARGQREVVAQVLELCPTNKALWSTDGHWWPESFYLAAIQAREVVYDVLSDAVEQDELSELEAVDIVKQMFFSNANRLYKLGLDANWEA